MIPFARFEENQQDEFLRSPRWMLALWSSASVHHLILISPYEAYTLVSILRSSQIQNASLHRFAPRTRRDQAELLISDLTLWPGNRPIASRDTLNTCLTFGAMAMTFFGGSTCLESWEAFGRSKAEFCNFLSIILPPSCCQIGIDDSDWNVLIDEGWINSEGFVVRSSVDNLDSKISDTCRQIIARIGSTRFWRRSPVAVMRALISIRNMSAFFPRSDVEFILLTK